MISFKSRTAIIILNYNNYMATCENINRLLALNGDYFLVIVDNNSINESVKYLRSKYDNVDGIIIVESKNNGGYSAGNNLGAKTAIRQNSNLKFIAIMNPDVIIKNKEIFGKMLDKATEYKNVAVVAPRMIENGVLQGKRSGWMLAGIWERILSRTPFQNMFHSEIKAASEGSYQYIDAVHGSFFIIKKNIFEKIKFLDSNIFLYGEETALGIKVKKAGYAECIDNDYTYVHNHDYSSETADQMIKQGKITYNSMKYIIEQYYNPSWYHLFLFLLVQGSLYYIYFPTLLKFKRFVKRIK